MFTFWARDHYAINNSRQTYTLSYLLFMSFLRINLAHYSRTIYRVYTFSLLFRNSYNLVKYFHQVKWEYSLDFMHFFCLYFIIVTILDFILSSQNLFFCKIMLEIKKRFVKSISQKLYTERP